MDKKQPKEKETWITAVNKLGGLNHIRLSEYEDWKKKQDEINPEEQAEKVREVVRQLHEEGRKMKSVLKTEK